MRWLLISVLALVCGRVQADNQQAVEFFHQRIEPILVGHCLECHGDAAKGKLNLRARGTAIAGGESGAAIEPGNPADSLLYEYVSSGEMPPKEPLTADQISAIEEWIRDGAYFPAEPINPFAITTDRRAGYDWWSLQPLKTTDPPEAPSSWAASAIDRYVYSKLAAAGLEPSPPAHPATLIRRATYDLTGLPPTPERLEAFLVACQQETGKPGVVGSLAYEQLIDQLLGSQHYGEHWGRHWLDVVRFGESNGFERNIIHENVWPFRDYVIRSLNDDKPFDQFVLEHLAGDSFGVDDPDVAVGTAFLVCGPYDNVGNQDKNAAAQIRANTIDEMIRTTSETFLGLTVGCSRCHDHKFDPISQQDYYSMYATLAGVSHGERTLRRKLQPESARSETNATAAESIRPAVIASINTETFEPVDAKFVRFSIRETNSSEPCIDELEIFTHASSDEPSRNIATVGTATSSGDYMGNERHKLIHINDGHYGNDKSWISDTNGKGWVQIEFPNAYTIDRIVWGRDRKQQYQDRLATNYRIEVATMPNQWRTVASSENRRPYEGGNSADPNVLKWWVGKFQQQDGPFHVFVGGSPQRRGQQVVPASLRTLDGTTERYQLDSTAPEQQRRRRLAEWIVADDNPLTARVLANRLWHYHFGTGIVNTPSDFGFLGGRPSHPDLLDHLAIQLKRDNWRLKPMHRRIMLSQTYRQASDYRAAAAKVDRDSRLLWRFPPRRLSGEEIRDSTLAVTGVLDTTMGGPGFRLFRYVQDNVATYHPLDKHGADTYRRAIYHHNARAMQIDLMSEFDTPDCAFSTPSRSSTTTPLQALTLMNHSFTFDMAQALAERIESESNDTAGQIKRAFLLAFSRSPTEEEVWAAELLIGSHGMLSFCRALLNANEFIHVD